MKKWVIWVISILIVILVVWSLLNVTCIDSKEMCKRKPDGTFCNVGVWCDPFGRICGGQSCVGMSLGKCQAEECVSCELGECSIYGCVRSQNDSNGYLFEICNYIKKNKIDVGIDPTKYNIEKIEELNCSERNLPIQCKGEKVLVIYLDCCYMGDTAYIDKETEEVIWFNLGDI